ncbi:hemagglutinin repeat-containing protein, partial [Variovorax sp. WDL1]
VNIQTPSPAGVSRTRFNATQVSGGQAVNITSGGDLALRGALVDGNRVAADVGGNLNIESLQDVSVGQTRQSSSGLNVSLCIPPICYGAVATVGGSAAGAEGDGVFISPNTQAGIKAGDGGFDVNVRGDTHLRGAVIESTQAAIDAGKNSFQTGGALTMSDLQNVSSSNGSSYAVSGGVSLGYTTAAGATPSLDPKDGQWAVPPSGSAGLGSDSGGDQNSTTRSGISGIAGDQSVSTGYNASAGTLVRDWNTQAIVRDVQAQAQITHQFNQNAAREIGTYADRQRDVALARRDPAEAARWDEGGEYRVTLHTAAGALSGGVAGALGAGASAALMPRVGDAIAEMGLPTPVAQALGAVTAAAIGATVGGAAGAASAYSVDINNRQLHPTERGRLREEAKRIAREQIQGFDRLTPEQQAKAETYWYNQLAQAALARVDDNGQANRDAYVAAVAGTDQPGLQGTLSASQALADAAAADRVVAGLANESRPITNMYGEAVQAGGQSLIAFNATAEQRANSYLLNTPSTEAERQQIANRNTATLTYLGAVNGGAVRDYTVEEFLLGGAIGGRAVRTVGGALERASTVLTTRGPVRTGPYEGAGVTVDDARALLSERELPAGPGTLKGQPEAPRANAAAEDIRGITRQNEAAQTLSEHGLNVEQLPNNSGATRMKQPDLKINGEVADVYSPNSGNVQSIWDAINKKANPAETRTYQAPNVVVNLADSPLSASEVAQFLQRNPVGGLRNLILIKDGKVTTFNAGW